MSIPLKGFPSFVGTVSSGVYQNAQGTFLDLSGIGVDLSNTAVIKVAPFNNNKNSFYALLDLSNNFINNVDCSGANIVRVNNGSILPVGHIANPSSINAFVCDTSGNLWVGGANMSVKKTSNDATTITETESMFIIPIVGTVQPTAFLNVDVSGCNDICPVEDLMIASVVDISGRCLNYVSSGTSNDVTIGSVVLPRIRGNTAAFSVTMSPGAGGPVLADKDMDLSGHRLAAFARTGDYGNDVSGFYIVRSNSSGGTAAGATLGDAAGTTNIGNINYTLALNKLAYDSDRNKLYVSRNTNDKYPIVLPLDVSAVAYTSNYTVKSDALLKYAGATSSTAGAVDSSGFMVVCTNPTATGAGPVIKLDASGLAFDTLTLLDVSGVVAMDTTVATYGSNNYNYIFLVDASRNVVDPSDSSKNAKSKLAEIWLSARSANDGDYVDGSGISFVHAGNNSFGYDASGAYVRDLRIDACGNIFLGGHQIFIQNDQTIESDNIQSTSQLNIVSATSLLVATSNLPLLGNDLPYDSAVTLTEERETSEITNDFTNNRDPFASVDNLLKGIKGGQLNKLMVRRL